MRIFVNPRVMLIFGTIVCVGISIAAVYFHDADWVRQDQAVAAWIQASFSILGIVAALTFPVIDADRREKADADRRLRLFIQVLVAAAEIVERSVGTAQKGHSRAGFGRAPNLHQWRVRLEMLNAFPIGNLGTAEQLGTLLRFRSLLEKAIRDAQSAEDLDFNHMDYAGRWVPVHTHMTAMLAVFKEEIAGLQRQLR